jgi:hypothetical protein
MNGDLVIAEMIPYLVRKEWRSRLEARLRNLSSGLDVSVQLEGVTSNGFVKIGVQGSDSEVFTELTKRNLGLAPSDLSDVEVHDNFKAYATKIDPKRHAIEVAIGPVSTRSKSEIPREALIAQLSDGRNIPVHRIARAYCIEEGVPILVRITSIDLDRRHIEAWISDSQISRFEQWRRERFHRIIAVGGFQDELREAVRFSKVERDVIELEELALTAHSLVCKLGTDAPGIIAKIGRHISNFKLHAFLPDRVEELRFGYGQLQKALPRSTSRG